MDLKSYPIPLHHLQARDLDLILAGVDIDEDTILQRFMRRIYTTDVLNRRLDTSVIESNNIWR